MRVVLIPPTLRLPSWARLPLWPRRAAPPAAGAARPALPPSVLSTGLRASRAVRSTGQRLALIWEAGQESKIPRLLLILLLSVVLLGVVVYYIERAASEETEAIITSLEKGLWWAIVTMTTTGYGDFYPKTTFGRIAGSLTMLAGIVVMAFLTASFAAASVARSLREARGLQVLNVSGHTIICGWSDRAEEVLTGLLTQATGGRPTVVLVNQLPEETLAALRTKYRRANLYVVRGDHTLEEVLDRAGVARAAAVVILADSVGAPAREDDRTLRAMLTIEHLNPEAKTTVEVRQPANEAGVRSAGADDVVVAQQDVGFFLAGGAVAPGIGLAAREMLRAGGRAEILRAEFPHHLRGRTYGEAFGYYHQQGILLLGIISERPSVTLDDVLGAGTSWLDEFIRRMLAETSEDILGGTQEKTQVLFSPDDGYQLSVSDAALIIGGRATVS